MPLSGMLPLSWASIQAHRQVLQEMLDAFRPGCLLLDEQLHIHMGNITAQTIFGDADGILEGKLADFFLPEDLPIYESILHMLNESVGNFSFEIEHRINQELGGIRWLRCSLTSFPAVEPNRLVVFSLLTDVTDEKHAREAREASEKRYRTLFNAAADAMMVISPNGILLDINAMGCKHVGAKRKELVGKDITAIFTPARQQLVNSSILEVMAKGEHSFEALLVNPDSPIPVEINAKTIDYQGQPAILGIARDITERKLLQARLEYQASTDPLTGLNNRRHFLMKAEQEFLRFKRYGHGFAMLMLDLDFFKKVNDTYGHQTGDALLREFAQKMRIAFRHSDLLGRIGGEEFAVMLIESGLCKGTEIAERLRQLVHDSPLHINDTVVHYTVSVGGTIVAPEDNSLEEIIRRADSALYTAKRNGRNQVNFETRGPWPLAPQKNEDQP